MGVSQAAKTLANSLKKKPPIKNNPPKPAAKLVLNANYIILFKIC